MNIDRLKLHEELVKVMSKAYHDVEPDATIDDFSHNVYFQAPTTVQIKYPALIYERSSGMSRHADNSLYDFKQRYTVTIIDPNPDSVILQYIVAMPLCRYDRHYVVNNLHHDVFDLYY